MTNEQADEQTDLEPIRRPNGTFAPGRSGNPKGAPKRERVSREEAWRNLPEVVRMLIEAARAGGKTWTEKLRDDNPGQFASVMLRLSSWLEDDIKTNAEPEFNTEAADRARRTIQELQSSTGSADRLAYLERRVAELEAGAAPVAPASAEGPSAASEGVAGVDAIHAILSRFKSIFRRPAEWSDFQDWIKARKRGRAQAVIDDASRLKLALMTSDPDDADFDPDADEIWTALDGGGAKYDHRAQMV